MSTDTQGGEAFVILSGPDLEWAIEARHVRQIVSRRDWTGAPPTDMAVFWGLADVPEEAARVLSVETSGGAVGIRAGRLSFRSIERSSIAPLPRLFDHLPSARLIEGVAFCEGKPPLVVIHAEALSAAFQSQPRVLP
jgi:hypothetical protein